MRRSWFGAGLRLVLADLGFRSRRRGLRPTNGFDFSLRRSRDSSPMSSAGRQVRVKEIPVRGGRCPRLGGFRRGSAAVSIAILPPAEFLNLSRRGRFTTRGCGFLWPRPCRCLSSLVDRVGRNLGRRGPRRRLIVRWDRLGEGIREFGDTRRRRGGVLEAESFSETSNRLGTILTTTDRQIGSLSIVSTISFSFAIPIFASGGTR